MSDWMFCVLEELHGFLVDWFGFVVLCRRLPSTYHSIVFCAPYGPGIEYKE